MIGYSKLLRNIPIKIGRYKEKKGCKMRQKLNREKEKERNRNVWLKK